MIKLTENEVRAVQAIESGASSLEEVANALDKKVIAVRGLVQSLKRKGVLAESDSLRLSGLALADSGAKLPISIDTDKPTSILECETLGQNLVLNGGHITPVPLGTGVEDLEPTHVPSTVDMSRAIDQTVAKLRVPRKRAEVSEVDVVPGMLVPADDSGLIYKVISIVGEEVTYAQGYKSDGDFKFLNGPHTMSMEHFTDFLK